MDRRGRPARRARGRSPRGARRGSLRRLGRPRPDARRPDDRGPRNRNRPRARRGRGARARDRGRRPCRGRAAGPSVRGSLAWRPQAGVLPEGAVSLGLAGTAPAVLLEHDGRVAIALPGTARRAAAAVAARPRGRPVRSLVERAEPREHRLLRILQRSGVLRRPGRRVGRRRRRRSRDHDLRPQPGGRGRSVLPARGRGGGRAVAEAVEEEFGDAVYARDDRPVAAHVLDSLRGAGWTLAAAESCTGGLVSAALTDIAGSSDVFLGGAVTYSNAAKEALLGVPGDMLAAHGAVSEETARAMAAGARAAFGSDVAVSVTGIAGPGGGSAAKPVGLVHIAVASPEETTALEVQLPGSREEVRSRAATLALHEVRRLLTRSRGSSACWRPIVEPGERLRLFLALPLPDDARVRLAAWQASVFDGVRTFGSFRPSTCTSRWCSWASGRRRSWTRSAPRCARRRPRRRGPSFPRCAIARRAPSAWSSSATRTAPPGASRPIWPDGSSGWRLRA